MLTLHYIDDVLLNNLIFGDFANRSYEIEFKLRKPDIMDTTRSLSQPKLTTRASYEQNFTTNEMISIFPLLFPFIRRNISAALAYGEHISQLIRYFRVLWFMS